MNLQLEGKTALVTGSTAGIGLAIAAELAREGAAVIVNGRTQARVDAAMKSTGAAHGVAVDLATEAGAQAVFARFPAVDILVNNLGIFEPKPFEEIPDEDWRRFFEVNVLSGVRLSRAYLPGMKQRNWGRIVFISSESADSDSRRDDSLRHDEDRPAGGLARPGRDCAGTAVTVNAILPGPTRSAGVEDFVDRMVKSRGDARTVERGFFRPRASVVADRVLRRTGGGSWPWWRSCESACFPSIDYGVALRVDGRKRDRSCTDVLMIML